MAAAQEAGVTLVPLLDGDPANNYAPPDDFADFAAWAGAFAARYGAQIDAYFIWDEPNLTSHWGLQPVNPRAYAALLSAAAAAIRAADAGAVIVAAPLAPTVETGPENLSEPLFLRELYEGVQPTPLTSSPPNLTASTAPARPHRGRRCAQLQPGCAGAGDNGSVWRRRQSRMGRQLRLERPARRLVRDAKHLG